MQKLVLFLLLAVIFTKIAVSSPAATLSFIYIEPAEGESSGGHAALQIDNAVYDFQHDDLGLIQLKRHRAQDFQFNYRFLQNRPLHSAELNLTAAKKREIAETFSKQYWLQQQRNHLLNALKQDQLLLTLFRENLSHPSYAQQQLHLKYAGLFYQPADISPIGIPLPAIQSSQAMNELRAKIYQHYGNRFLTEKIKQVNQALHDLPMHTWSKSLTKKENNPYYSLSDSYHDLLTQQLSLYVLLQARPLNAAAWVSPDTSQTINPLEYQQLSQLKQALQTLILEQLSTSNPGLGQRLLVNLARWQAINRCLFTQNWYFVDAFAEDSAITTVHERQQYKAQFEQLTNDARLDFNKARQLFAQQNILSESAYSQLEQAGNRYAELQKPESTPIRVDHIKLIPEKSLIVKHLPMPQITLTDIDYAINQLSSFQQQVIETLEQEQSYHLLEKNCVTELFKLINIQAGQKPFIPYLAYIRLDKLFPLNKHRDLPSYRQLMLTQLSKQEPVLLSAMRESNTLSSSLYHYHDDDAFFMFFSDEFALLRPIFGATNAVAGISQSLLGIFMWPFDQGENLGLGAKGFLFSLPELVFINIRKGRFKYLPYHTMIR